MKKIEFIDLLEKVKEYSQTEKKMIEKAYQYAKDLHQGQYRQSGEPYVMHPLTVAYILADMHADCDTICAGLLHDTLEDTKITKEEIEENFNPSVAKLVNGVTKLSKMNFSSKQAQNYANTRKIITGITEDVRIIIIKLVDRLHNMRTLQFKSEFKQKENSLETMEIFVPLAYYLGAYQIKLELEDLSLQYLKPEEYKRLEEVKFKIEKESQDCLQEMLFQIQEILSTSGIPHSIITRTKNIYGIYKRLNAGHHLSDIHDLLALKVMVKEVKDCYATLGLIHQKYHPINDKFKDYICNPKTNRYQSLHTTVFGSDDRLVQTQIRTFDMDKIDSFGLTAYWEINKGQARDIMQEELKNKYQFFQSLVEINTLVFDNQEFVTKVKEELFSDKVYVYTTKGEIIELPKGSTPVDFAYQMGEEIGNTMVGAFVNDSIVPFNYSLKNKDRVRIITDKLANGPSEELISKAHTSHAKRKIKEFCQK
ncbi:MAG: RelA/SpoT family protein [Bacilli bacterium]|nr:RelA/SpoT family protein [Bacilli bacterium]